MVQLQTVPADWLDAGGAPLSTMHQIAPYIGKLKPAIARRLVEEFSAPGDTVLDPFCGSGTIPLEAAQGQRKVIASDTNPYACLLTKAKISPPDTIEEALARLHRAWGRASKRIIGADDAPEWVQKFFHPETLRSALALFDELIDSREHFLASCLLGILHHQRPGFLSFPSSHLIPYLRENKFPRDVFSEMYESREVLPRMEAKLARSYKIHSPLSVPGIVKRSSVAGLTVRGKVDALITSPPYMNALDYRRDNRLRLWFLDRATENYFPEPTDKKEGLRRMSLDLAQLAASCVKRGGYVVLVVGEVVQRKRLTSHPSENFLAALMSTERFALRKAIRDEIPDIRRSRREGRATKTEHILVLQCL
ncbi:conserved hypothetical protein [Xanthomonas citri pv. bilvae]|nr:conserved hypothetical protein [Xanthomonas citri pv. bilvae]